MRRASASVSRSCETRRGEQRDTVAIGARRAHLLTQRGCLLLGGAQRLRELLYAGAAHVVDDLRQVRLLRALRLQQ